MLQVFKIFIGQDIVDTEGWFKMASEAPVMKRQAAGPEHTEATIKARCESQFLLSESS